MAAYIIWFLLALAMLAAEMATGTFYLLVFGIALGRGFASANMASVRAPVPHPTSSQADRDGTLSQRRNLRSTSRLQRPTYGS